MNDDDNDVSAPQIGERQKRECSTHGVYWSTFEPAKSAAEDGWTECRDCFHARELRERHIEQCIEAAQLPHRVTGHGFDAFVADTAAKKRALKAAELIRGASGRFLSVG